MATGNETKAQRQAADVLITRCAQFWDELAADPESGNLDPLAADALSAVQDLADLIGDYDTRYHASLLAYIQFERGHRGTPESVLRSNVIEWVEYWSQGF